MQGVSPVREFVENHVDRGMIDRPAIPARRETHEVDGVLRWLDHAGTDLGV